MTPVEETVEALRRLGLEVEIRSHRPGELCFYALGHFYDPSSPQESDAVIEVAIRTAVRKKHPASYAAPYWRKGLSGVEVHLLDTWVVPLYDPNEADAPWVADIGKDDLEAWVNSAVALYRADGGLG